ncbi:MAG: hypothetical protein ACK595_16965, partial [Planctomycetota bacterium]
MRILAPLLCALTCAVPAKADTYWFAEPPAASAENPVLDCIRGVLLSEDADHYVLRVFGGEKAFNDPARTGQFKTPTLRDV